MDKSSSTAFKSVLLTLAFIAIALPELSPARAAGHGVGNGGDPLGDLYVQAREQAAKITAAYRDDALDALAEPDDVKSFIRTHKADLAADIAATKHDWVTSAEATCAWTDPSPNADIRLSYPTCGLRAAKFADAVTILIHESVHHLGGDEDMAYRAARVVTGFWESNGLHWVSLPPFDRRSSGRYKHTAVWTGATGNPATAERMIVWGGYDDNAHVDFNGGDLGGIFDPRSRTWTPISPKGPQRWAHVAVWTGDKMIVWGGYDGARSGETVVWDGDSSPAGMGDDHWYNAGAIYDPVAGTWTPLPAPAGEPEKLALGQTQTAVWTGAELIVWGGASLPTIPDPGVSYRTLGLPGKAYNPKTGLWRMLVPPDERYHLAGLHSAVWTGDEMIVWGGKIAYGYLDLKDAWDGITRNGFRYNPRTGVFNWGLGTAGPTARKGQQAIWTGSRLLIWGGQLTPRDEGDVFEAGLYDPKADDWQFITPEIAPPRLDASLVWTGKEAVVIGGAVNNHPARSAAAYDPLADAWRAFTLSSAPRSGQTAVWTGANIIVWGGQPSAGGEAGGIYYP